MNGAVSPSTGDLTGPTRVIGGGRGREREPTSIPVGALWMVVITVGLFFLPAVNGVIGGFVGGYKVGSPRRGLLAALVPCLVAGAGLWVLLVAVDLPVIGVVAGLGAAVLIAASNLGLFIGAFLGGLVAD